ncbi:MAG: hypothetical protein VKJ24_04110, partial [Synechococcales bacterium]|nr:hypothetical protein [Synechococcales bacterium]
LPSATNTRSTYLGTRSDASSETGAIARTTDPQMDYRERLDPAKLASQQGRLRVHNRSNHPVRLALLFQKIPQIPPPQTVVTGYDPPSHWDFAPREGREQGLLLGLPNRTTNLQKGDVIVAFAQDGSQRYWGPFVVGQTRLPFWNELIGEWQLRLDD